MARVRGLPLEDDASRNSARARQTLPATAITFSDLGLERRDAQSAEGCRATRPRRPSRPRRSRCCSPGATSSASPRPAPARRPPSRCRSSSRLDVSQKTPQALVLAPTRELALQVCEAFEKYAAHVRGVHVLPVYGGQGYGVQLSALRRGVHIVVGTPGRIMDHLEKGTLDLSRAQVPRARRGRRDAQDGLRRRRRDDPRRHPRRQAGRAVLGDDARRRSGGSRRSTCTTPKRSRSRTRPRPRRTPRSAT